MTQRSSSVKSNPVNGISTVSEHHLFYANPNFNNVKPPWFIKCDRKQAEEILKKHRKHGNVLIRPNSSFEVNGSYALSACTITNGEQKYVHYIISRTINGFKLEVQSKPAPMPCLETVLDFYIKAAGQQTHQSMAIDPTAPSNKKALSRNQTPANNDISYVNLPNSGVRNSAPAEGLYLQMTGNSKKSQSVQRRCSAPVIRDYINLPKGTATGAYPNPDDDFYLTASEVAYPNPDDFYLTASEVETEKPDGRDYPDYMNVTNPDYINVTNVMPNGNADHPRTVMHKASSFPVSRKEGVCDRYDDDDDEEDCFECFTPPSSNCS